MSDVKEMTVMEFCNGCKAMKFDPFVGVCAAYSPEGQKRWMRMRACPLGSVDLDEPAETKKQKVNLIKASKRAKKGK